MKAALLIPFLLLLFLPAASEGQELPPLPPGVDDHKVQLAVRKGIEWLKKQNSPSHNKDKYRNSDELILLTYLHGGVKEGDDAFKKYFGRMLKAPLERTYKVALQAMVLEELQRVKYQRRIWQCAQFLVDNQCKNGQWSYGTPTPAVKNVPEIPKKTATTGGLGISKQVSNQGSANVWPRPKPKVVNNLVVRKTRDGRPSGDNSNSQYGALGLRACKDAGIVLPAETIVKAVEWWRSSLHPSDPKDGVYGGRGWNYKDPKTQDKKPYHAMTAGGVGSLVIYDYILGREWKRDSFVVAGMRWMESHFAVNTNYYYMYGLERMGMMYGTEKVGKHFWYADGAKVLLKAQQADGHWGRRKPDDKENYRNVWDTCFSILFLARATRPLVASEDPGRRRKKK